MNPNYELFNSVIELVGIGPQRWFDDHHRLDELWSGGALAGWAAGPSLALIGVSLNTIWHFIGFQVVIFLAGLGNISTEYYEAARLDGASERQLFTKITLPLLSPTTFFVATIGTIVSLTAFTQIYV